MGVKRDRNAELRPDERGATATEYGLLVAFIGLIIVAGVGLFGGAVDTMFSDFGDWVTTTF